MGWPSGAQRRHAFSQSSPPWTANSRTRTLYVPVSNLKTWESWAEKKAEWLPSRLRPWARIMRPTFQLKEIKQFYRPRRSRCRQKGKTNEAKYSYSWPNKLASLVNKGLLYGHIKREPFLVGLTREILKLAGWVHLSRWKPIKAQDLLHLARSRIDNTKYCPY